LKGEADLKALVKQRTWDKEVLMWLGSEKSLIGALGSAKHTVLDLLDLFQFDKLPPDDDSTKDAIQGQLRQRLRAMPKGPDNRTILVVKSIGLLARYKVGLNDFYNWFIGSHTLVALLLEGSTEKFDWPDEVHCDTKRLLDYFNEPGMVKEVYAG
jgi:hypothetical protein